MFNAHLPVLFGLQCQYFAWLEVYSFRKLETCMTDSVFDVGLLLHIADALFN